MLHLHEQYSRIYCFSRCLITVPVLVLMAGFPAVEKQIVRISLYIENNRISCLICIGRIQRHIEIHICVDVCLFASCYGRQDSECCKIWYQFLLHVNK